MGGRLQRTFRSRKRGTRDANGYRSTKSTLSAACAAIFEPLEILKLVDSVQSFSFLLLDPKVGRKMSLFGEFVQDIIGQIDAAQPGIWFLSSV